MDGAGAGGARKRKKVYLRDATVPVPVRTRSRYRHSTPVDDSSSDDLELDESVVDFSTLLTDRSSSPDSNDSTTSGNCVYCS